MDERTPKEQALLEQIGQQAQQYEEKVANLRVTLTRQQQQIQQQAEQIVELQERIQEFAEDVQSEEQDQTG
jgi:hypothetical protein